MTPAQNTCKAVILQVLLHWWLNSSFGIVWVRKQNVNTQKYYEIKICCAY